MSRTRSAITAMLPLLASCSLVTGFGDLEFSGAPGDAGLDARQTDDGASPDLPLVPDAMRDVLVPDAPIRDVLVPDAPIRDVGPDALARPDAADMAIETACGVCPAPSPCTTATCTADGCSTARLPIGSACDDGSSCTEGTRCDSDGNCVGGTACPDDGNVCTDEICTPAGCGATVRVDGSPCGATPDYVCCAGRCVNTFVDAASCGRCGNRCTAAGCVAGECARSCATPDVCTPAGAPACVVSSCAPASGCTLTPTNSVCFIDGACYAEGEAFADNPCWQCDVSLSTTAWTPTAAGTPCDDHLSCSTGETCDGNGRCGGGSETCGIGGDCAVATCQQDVAGCTMEILPDGSSCADGAGVCCGGTCFTDRAFCG